MKTLILFSTTDDIVWHHPCHIKNTANKNKGYFTKIAYIKK